MAAHASPRRLGPFVLTIGSRLLAGAHLEAKTIMFRMLRYVSGVRNSASRGALFCHVPRGAEIGSLPHHQFVRSWIVLYRAIVCRNLFAVYNRRYVYADRGGECASTVRLVFAVMRFGYFCTKNRVGKLRDGNRGKAADASHRQNFYR